MSNYSANLKKRKAKMQKIRSKSGKEKRYEVFITKSSFHVAAYLYDKVENRCLVGSCSSAKKFIEGEKDIKSGTVVATQKFGLFFKNKVNAMKIDMKDTYFNRSGYFFHGRVKAFYDGCFGE